MFNNGWTPFLKSEFEKPYFQKLSAFLKKEYELKTIYPPKEEVFAAFGYTDYHQLKCVIVGQDPYHQPNQACGLSFSVVPNVKYPPSLHNIFLEYVSDLQYPYPSSGSLIPWASQGVLLLNAVLTVEANKPASHRNQGWEIFTDEVLRQCNLKSTPVVFILWGKFAQSKKDLITQQHHLVLLAPHPSPLSAYQGFFGSKPFSQANHFLIQNQQKPIHWQLKG